MATEIPPVCAYGECTLPPRYMVNPIGKWTKMGVKYGCREHARQMAAAFSTVRDGKVIAGAEVFELPSPEKPRTVAARKGAPKRRTVSERRAATSPADASPAPPPAPEPTAPQAPQSP